MAKAGNQLYSRIICHMIFRISEKILCLIYLISYRNRKVFNRTSNFLRIYISKLKNYSALHLMTLKRFNVLKNVEFYDDFMSVKINLKKLHPKKLYRQKTFAKQ